MFNFNENDAGRGRGASKSGYFTSPARRRTVGHASTSSSFPPLRKNSSVSHANFRGFEEIRNVSSSGSSIGCVITLGLMLGVLCVSSPPPLGTDSDAGFEGPEQPCYLAFTHGPLRERFTQTDQQRSVLVLIKPDYGRGHICQFVHTRE